jgi:hypothetical protein
MYIYYDGDSLRPNIFLMDQSSIKDWADEYPTHLDCNACVWIIPGTVDPRD